MFIRRSTHEGERGVTLIMVALSLTALLGVTGLVIDGGRGYAERRQMQNAADSSALAGTRQLDLVRNSLLDALPATLDADVVFVAAREAASKNGAELGAKFECYIVDETGAYVTGAAATSRCPEPDANPTTPMPGGTDAAGVEVVSRNSEQTYFARVLGNDSFTARAGATAQVEGLRKVDAGVTPFMLCAYARGTTEGPDLLIPSGDEWLTNPAAVWSPTGTDSTGNGLPGGPWYIVHGPNNEDVPGCNSASEGFKGLVDQSGNWSLPGWWGSKPGVNAGPTKAILSGTGICNGSTLDNCIIVIPMCVNGRGQGGNTELECIRFGAFKIADTGNGGSGNRHHVALLGDASVIVGEGQGGGVPQLGELRVIKLTK